MLLPAIPYAVQYGSILIRSGALVSSLVSFVGLFRDVDLNDSYSHTIERSRIEENIATETDAIQTDIKTMVESYSEADYDAEVQVPAKADPIVINTTSDVTLIDILKRSNQISSSRIEVAEEHVSKLVDQNKILYDMNSKLVEQIGYIAAIAGTLQGYIPSMATAAINQAASLKGTREHVAATEGLETYVNVPPADMTPVADAVNTVSDKLTAVSDNALAQKAIADFQMAPQTVLDSELQPLATGTPLEIYLQRNAAQAKNETDEAEFEIPDDVLDEIDSGGFAIPGMEGFDPNALNTFLLNRVTTS
jgi:hypothetical protein